MPTLAKQVLVTDMLSKAKDPKDNQNREVYEFEQAPMYFEKSVLEQTLPTAPAPKYRMVAETEIKNKIGIDKPDGTKTSTKMK